MKAVLLIGAFFIACMATPALPTAAQDTAPSEETNEAVDALDYQSAGENWSFSDACPPELISGVYLSIAGDITCVPGGAGLECCYGNNGCQQRLSLRPGEGGRMLVGEWIHMERRKGPVEFGLTDECAITHGRWGFTRERMINKWTVGNRKE